MAVKDLHEAAKVLQGAHQAIEKLFTEAAPMMMQYFDDRAALGSTGDVVADDAAADELWSRSGYSPFVTAIGDLIVLLESVDDADRADLMRRLSESQR